MFTYVIHALKRKEFVISWSCRIGVGAIHRLRVSSKDFSPFRCSQDWPFGLPRRDGEIMYVHYCDLDKFRPKINYFPGVPSRGPTNPRCSSPGTHKSPVLLPGDPQNPRCSSPGTQKIPVFLPGYPNISRLQVSRVQLTSRQRRSLNLQPFLLYWSTIASGSIDKAIQNWLPGQKPVHCLNSCISTTLLYSPAFRRKRISNKLHPHGIHSLHNLVSQRQYLPQTPGEG
jgi:hypothetical protein